MTLPLNLNVVEINAFQEFAGGGFRSQKFIVAEVREVASGEVLGLVIRSCPYSETIHYHRDILARLNNEISTLGLIAKCVGGGLLCRGWRDGGKKSLTIEGKSGDFGYEPDRNVTLAMIQNTHPDYLVECR